MAASEAADYILPQDVTLIELPYYSSWYHVREVARALTGTVSGFWRGLSKVDTVWIFGPNPFSLLLVALAALRRKRVVLGVRQDTVSYFRARLPSRAWLPALLPALTLDRAYRLLARRIPTTVVGAAVARRYGEERSTVLAMTVSLVRASDVAPSAPRRDWSGTVKLLTVGRFEREKNPFLLVETIAELERRDQARFHLTWVGRGSLEDALRERVAELGLNERIRFLGYVPFGPGLLDLYRGSHVFVHVSLTEGVPQVLLEAFACGTPVVATDVGGIAGALEEGRAGLLVPPGDVSALTEAVERLAADEELRAQLIERGLELARRVNLDVEAARIAAFVGGDSGISAAGSKSLAAPAAE